mmetsp:Transcript_13659/g.47573  ORF Transcript_13659/g.47573 Transcript_13659/m.47573 type:complete len:256 (+) Transcript_13659:1081-1848(+)
MGAADAPLPSLFTKRLAGFGGAPRGSDRRRRVRRRVGAVGVRPRVAGAGAAAPPRGAVGRRPPRALRRLSRFARARAHGRHGLLRRREAGQPRAAGLPLERRHGYRAPFRERCTPRADAPPRRAAPHRRFGDARRRRASLVQPGPAAARHEAADCRGKRRRQGHRLDRLTPRRSRRRRRFGARRRHALAPPRRLQFCGRRTWVERTGQGGGRQAAAAEQPARCGRAAGRRTRLAGEEEAAALRRGVCQLPALRQL